MLVGGMWGAEYGSEPSYCSPKLLLLLLLRLLCEGAASPKLDLLLQSLMPDGSHVHHM